MNSPLQITATGIFFISFKGNQLRNSKSQGSIPWIQRVALSPLLSLWSSAVSRGAIDAYGVRFNTGICMDIRMNKKKSRNPLPLSRYNFPWLLNTARFGLLPQKYSTLSEVSKLLTYRGLRKNNGKIKKGIQQWRGLIWTSTKYLFNIYKWSKNYFHFWSNIELIWDFKILCFSTLITNSEKNQTKNEDAR